MNSIGPLFFRLRWLTWLVLLGLMVAFATVLMDIPRPTTTAAVAPTATAKAPNADRGLRFPVAQAIPPEHLALVPPPKAAPPPRNLDDHYQLAAIFVRRAGGFSKSRAILDDLKAQRTSKTVYKGDTFDGLTILNITAKAVEVEFDNQRGTMTIEGNRIARAPAPAPRERTETLKERPLRFWERPALSESKYGKQIEETRWVLDRAALNGYYEDVTKDPVGLLKLFASFETQRDQNTRKINGFKLQFKGEQPFLKAVGLRQDDVVRRVNGRPMTSQRQAEYWITQFRADRMGSVVMEVERDGEKKNLIYLFHDDSVESDGL